MSEGKQQNTGSPSEQSSGMIDRFLNLIEVAGNKLPDPAVLFLLLMLSVWFLSWPLSLIQFDAVHPMTKEPIAVSNQVNGDGIASLLTSMVDTFVNFAPLGVVLVSLLGIGVAEHTGLIGVVIKTILGVVPKSLLTPALLLVGIGSHYAVDAGYVLVIPIGGVVFYAAGRHPLAGITAAFAGVSGGFAANFFIPSGLDPLLQGFTLTAAQLYDDNVQVSIVNNNVFTAASTLLIVSVGWFITDRIIEPRVQSMEVDGDPDQMPTFEEVRPEEKRGMYAAITTVLIGLAAMVFAAFVLGAVLITPRVIRRGGEGVEDRSQPARYAMLTSLLPANAVLARDGFLLRWSPGPADTLYGVRLSTEDGGAIHRADRIEASEHRVPPEALADLPADTTLLWRVEAVLPDATRVTSPRFRVRLE